MSEILFVRKSPLKTFLIRRFSRVYPALLFYVVVISLVFAGSPYAHGAVAAVLALTFTLNYGMVYSHQVALLDHLWSLCVEEHSYAVLAIVALFARRAMVTPWIVLGTLGLLAMLNGMLQTYVVADSFFHVYWRTDVAAAGLLMSGALWLRLNSAQIASWVAPVVLAAAVVCKIIPVYLINSGLSTIFLAIAVTTVDKAPKMLLSALSSRPLCKIGLWSYSLYLWQQPFYKLHLAGAAQLPLLLTGVLACALTSFYLIERPAREAINSYVGQRKLRLAMAA